MLQALSWMILLLALTRGAWLAFAPDRYLEDRRRRWETRATHALGLSHQQPRLRARRRRGVVLSFGIPFALVLLTLRRDGRGRLAAHRDGLRCIDRR